MKKLLLFAALLTGASLAKTPAINLSRAEIAQKGIGAVQLGATFDEVANNLAPQLEPYITQPQKTGTIKKDITNFMKNVMSVAQELFDIAMHEKVQLPDWGAVTIYELAQKTGKQQLADDAIANYFGMLLEAKMENTPGVEIESILKLAQAPYLKISPPLLEKSIQIGADPAIIEALMQRGAQMSPESNMSAMELALQKLQHKKEYAEEWKKQLKNLKLAIPKLEANQLEEGKRELARSEKRLQEAENDLITIQKTIEVIKKYERKKRGYPTVSTGMITL